MNLTTETKIQLNKRLQSFTWRLAMALLVFGLDWIAQNIGLLELDVAVTGVIALMAGEVSKYLNNKRQRKI